MASDGVRMFDEEGKERTFLPHTPAKSGDEPMRQGSTAYGVGGKLVFRGGFEPPTCCFNRLLLSLLSYRNIEAAHEPQSRACTYGQHRWGKTVRRLRASVGLCGFADGTIQSQILLPCKCRWV